MRKLDPLAGETKPDVPARAEDVLGRPDPNEMAQVQTQAQEQDTVRVYNAEPIINLDPLAKQNGSTAAVISHSNHASIHSNPFGDNHSIQTTSTGTQSNVIPIAFVPPGSAGRHSIEPAILSTKATVGSAGATGAAESVGPVRPARAPDLDINTNPNHTDASSDSIHGSQYAGSQRSGLSTMNNPRMSYMSTGSYASDLLTEAPVIVTPTRGTVKQVLGVVKAEVIRTSPQGSPLNSPAITDSATLSPGPSAVASRPSVRSPLAGSSFGPSDVVREVEEEQELAMRGDPFGDEHSTNSDGKPKGSPSPSVTTFGMPSPLAPSRNPETTAPTEQSQGEGDWTPTNPRLPWADRSDRSDRPPRPESVNTQAGSIIGSVIIADIGNATRVHLGYDRLGATVETGVPVTPNSVALSTPRSNHRMTSARLVSPPGGTVGPFERQQQIAMQELDGARRVSTSSVLTTSTRADSILESFPFVPPSPISNRPIRTPPRSPLAEQNFSNAQPEEPKPFPQTSSKESLARPQKESHPPVVNRHLSVASQSSAMSSGLGSFPFQIDSGTAEGGNTVSSSPPSAFLGRQRASLDTLALTSDLSSYPLGFDTKANNYPPSPRR